MTQCRFSYLDLVFTWKCLHKKMQSNKQLHTNILGTSRPWNQSIKNSPWVFYMFHHILFIQVYSSFSFTLILFPNLLILSSVSSLSFIPFLSILQFSWGYCLFLFLEFNSPDSYNVFRMVWDMSLFRKNVLFHLV